MTSARLLRYASFLAGFDYTVVFRKGIDNKNVDCLSRAPIKSTTSNYEMQINQEVHQVCAMTISEISSLELTADSIAKETGKDKELSEIKQNLLSTSIESEYTLDNGILFKGNRILIPKSLQQMVLNELHSTHIGITKMKQLARRYCTWKNIDKDIENLVKSCEQCQSLRNQPAKAPAHHWDPPKNNWDRVHIDYAGPFQGYYYFLLIDAKSRWAEIKPLREAPNSIITINLLNEIFSIHGYPLVMVSDNASIFTSGQFTQYCRENGIKQKFIAPGHPATNGLAERNVQTLKHRLKTMENEDTPINLKIQNIVFKYRATPLANGKSPAEIYLNRQLRIKLDAMRPYGEEISQQPLLPHTRFFQMGERVQAQYFYNNKKHWEQGKIIKKLGKLHYIVKLDKGPTIKRHINQLLSSLLQKKKVTFQDKIKDACISPDQSSPFVPDLIQFEGSQSTTNRNQLTEIEDQQPDINRTPRPIRARKAPSYLREYAV